MLNISHIIKTWFLQKNMEVIIPKVVGQTNQNLIVNRSETVRNNPIIVTCFTNHTISIDTNLSERNSDILFKDPGRQLPIIG